MNDQRPLIISQATLDEVARVAREWPDGIHTCAELQVLEPGRSCTCGRCPARELDWPGEGWSCVHYTGTPDGSCAWCGMTAGQIAAERQGQSCPK